jgi:hypothetical protein
MQIQGCCRLEDVLSLFFTQRGINIKALSSGRLNSKVEKLLTFVTYNKSFFSPLHCMKKRRIYMSLEVEIFYSDAHTHTIQLHQMHFILFMNYGTPALRGELCATHVLLHAWLL